MEELRPWQWDWVALAAFLAAFAAIFGSWASNKNSLRATKSITELKILEFRHNWINQLRGEMVSFHACMMAIKASENEGITFETHQSAASHGKSIQLLMNPDDPDYFELVRLMTLMGTVNLQDVASVRELTDNFASYTELCQRILKREWERLKLDKEAFSNA